MAERPHITNTNYKRRGAGDLMSYMNKDGATLWNRVGQEMDPDEQQTFLDKSDYHQFTRHYKISPDRNDLTDEEMQEAVRDSVAEYFDGDSVDFCFAVHDPAIRNEESDELHAHVAVVGQEGELTMDEDDLRDFKNQSRETFKQVERDYEILRKLERIEELKQEQEQDQDLDQEPEFEEWT